jgi:hypothetical protein
LKRKKEKSLCRGELQSEAFCTGETKFHFAMLLASSPATALWLGHYLLLFGQLILEWRFLFLPPFFFINAHVFLLLWQPADLTRFLSFETLSQLLAMKGLC